MLFFMNNTEQKAKTVNCGKENGGKMFEITEILKILNSEDIW